MDIKISIVTVTYNSDKYIKNTLDSILNQQDFLYEYWIIDGGSKDKTIDIVNPTFLISTVNLNIFQRRTGEYMMQ